MHSKRFHGGLSAHLLAQDAGYRSAGISGYIHHLIAALPDADPSFMYTVFTGAQAIPPARAGLIAQRSRWNTISPLKRIAW